MNSWENENDTLIRIKLIEAEYANAFLERGSIKFNTPSAWVDYEKKHGDGRGDLYEGTMAFCHYADIEKILELKNKYTPHYFAGGRGKNLNLEVCKNRILFKDKQSMQLPCFCIYLCKASDLELPTRAGKQKFKVEVPGSYFKDFANNMTPDEVAHLPEERQPAMIIIEDLKKFRERLYIALKKIGIKESQILEHSITYYDFEKFGKVGWEDFCQEYPMELFVKNNRFKNQHEGRIIINTSDRDILDILKNPIELGDMSDIAKVSKGYYDKGIEIELEVDVYEHE